MSEEPDQPTSTLRAFGSQGQREAGMMVCRAAPEKESATAAEWNLNQTSTFNRFCAKAAYWPLSSIP